MGLPKGKGREWEGLGAWGREMQNVAFGIDQQWDPAVQPWELCLVTYDVTRNVRKKKTYTCMCDWVDKNIYINK